MAMWAMGAHNLVIEQLASDIHVILNPDVVIDERALLTVIDIFHNNRSVVMLSPSAINSDGEKQYLCKYYPDILTLAIRAFIPSPLISLFKKDSQDKSCMIYQKIRRVQIFLWSAVAPCLPIQSH